MEHICPSNKYHQFKQFSSHFNSYVFSNIDATYLNFYRCCVQEGHKAWWTFVFLYSVWKHILLPDKITILVFKCTGIRTAERQENIRIMISTPLFSFYLTLGNTRVYILFLGKMVSEILIFISRQIKILGWFSYTFFDSSLFGGY